MESTRADKTGWKRLVTTDGRPIGWARRGAGEEWYATPDPGLLRGCDSWIAPSWHEDHRFRLDPDAVVGEGEATVVLGADSEAATLLGRAASGKQSATGDDRSKSGTEQSPGAHR